MHPHTHQGRSSPSPSRHRSVKLLARVGQRDQGRSQCESAVALCESDKPVSVLDAIPRGLVMLHAAMYVRSLRAWLLCQAHWHPKEE